MTTNASVYSGGRAVHNETLSGSVMLNPAISRPLLHNRNVVDRGGAALRLFVDYDGDGERSEGEPFVENARAQVKGGLRVARGRADAARFVGLRPGARYDVVVDAASIPNPMWVPEREQFSLIAEANTMRSIDIPLLVAGTAEGAVVRVEQGAGLPLAGAKVHLRRVDGDFQRTEFTFSDGSFYSLSLPPGSYEAEVDAEQLARLGMRSEPAVLQFTVERSEQGDYVGELAFELHKVEAAAPADAEQP